MCALHQACRAWALAAALLLAACGQPSDTEALLTARNYMAKGDSAAASITLKTLLQAQPQSGEARFLLGKLLLEDGDAAGAEAELTRALQAGHDENQALPLMAQVQLALQKPALLVQQSGKVDLKDDQAAAELKTLVATAYLGLGSLDDAADAIRLALQRAPGYAPALVLQARLRAAQGDVAQAQALLSQVLAKSPEQTEAWVLQGDLLAQAESGHKAAIQAYSKALAQKPKLAYVHAAVLSMQLADRDFEAAAAQWAQMKRALPQHAQTLFFEAALALHKGDAKRAREITQAMLRTAPHSPRLLLLAGQAEMQLQSWTQAEALLGRAVQGAPDAPTPRRMLAEVFLRTGQGEKALLAIRPLLDAKQPDADLLALAARAQLMAGDAGAAEASFARAAKIKPDDARIRASVALAQVGQGVGRNDTAQGALVALATAAKADAGTSADLALISAHLRRKDFDAALKAVLALAAKQPQQALPDYLRGRIALQRRDAATARKAFDAALAKEPGYFAAIVSLAALDLGEGKADAARARLQDFVQREPGHGPARMALVELAARSGASRPDVARLIEDAVKASPGDASARAALIDHFMAGKETALALSAAQSAVASLPDNVDLLDRLGRVQLAAGNTLLATATFSKWAQLQPRSAAPQLRLVDAHLVNKDLPAALASVRKAMDAEPLSLAAQRAGVTLALRDKKPAQALAITRTVQAQRPAEATGWLLEGEVELSQQNFDAAAAAFRKAMAKPQGDEAAMRLHTTLMAANKTAAADRWAEDRLKQHPEDTAFAFYLGESALGQKNLALAEARFAQVLKRAPDHVMALNNVAYLLAQQGKPGAVPLAERAVKLAPDRAVLLDTLALSYAQDKQLDKAVAAQARAVALAPTDADYRFNLARLHLQAGHKDLARAELNKLVPLGKAFAGHDEVTRLLQTLGG